MVLRTDNRIGIDDLSLASQNFGYEVARHSRSLYTYWQQRFHRRRKTVRFAIAPSDFTLHCAKTDHETLAFEFVVANSLKFTHASSAKTKEIAKAKVHASGINCLGAAYRNDGEISSLAVAPVTDLLNQNFARAQGQLFHCDVDTL